MSQKVDTYHLGRSKNESQALNEQHYRSVANVGFLLHPNVTSAPSKVADLGTGTGVFLIDLSEQLPKETQLVGFDVSADQFPPADQRPANVDLRVHSFMNPFPESERGTYDLVHLRYVILAIDGLEGWTAVLNNAISLLKPGGWLQWLDTDTTNMTVYQQKPGTSRENSLILIDGMKSYFKSMNRGYGIGGKRVNQLCREAGMENVQEDVFTVDRNVEGREYFTNRILGSFKTVLDGYRKQADCPPDWMEAKWDEAVEKAQGEAAQGVYLHLDQICVVAQKPLDK